MDRVSKRAKRREEERKGGGEDDRWDRVFACLTATSPLAYKDDRVSSTGPQLIEAKSRERAWLAVRERERHWWGLVVRLFGEK